MKHSLLLIVAISALCVPAIAQKDQGTSTALQMRATATVMAIDQATRTVTLKTAEGKELTTVVSPEVRNLAQVHVGDLVNITYTVAFAVRLNPTNAAPNEAVAAAAKAKPGEKPAAAAGGWLTINAKVEAIDLKANTVTFKGPKGNLRTVVVRDPAYQEKLKKVKVGDVVEITYAEALTISVESAKKN